MANTLRGGLASAMSGLAYWSHDIGGFWGDPSPALYVRWAQLAAASAGTSGQGTNVRGADGTPASCGGRPGNSASPRGVYARDAHRGAQ